MGRRERTIDRASDPIARLAADLRVLRQRAGSPTYRQLADHAHYSPSALSQAASGQRLPTLPILLGFVEACGGDADEWTRRWTETAEALRVLGKPADAPPPMGRDDAPPSAATGAADPSPAASGSTHLFSGRSSRLVVAGAVLAAFAVLVGLTVLAPRSPDAGAVTTPSRVPNSPAALPTGVDPVADGSDPKRSGCADDGVTLDATDLFFPARRLAGTVQLRYSPRCRVAWVRFVPASTGRGPNDTVTVETYRPYDGADLPFTITYGDGAVFGNILLTTKGCVAARASVVHDGQASATVSTGCRTGPA